ncbi:MAG: TrpR-like protein, YerC/YecD [Clostridia bacterium]|nr:TrpR-like protein, YerC/YecD [Clostridia bacterium]
MPKDNKSALKDYLFQAILTLESVDECYDFFDDLCTIKEVDDMANRLCGAKMLTESMVYTDITGQTGLSTATISRINRCLKHGRGGYATALERLENRQIHRPEPGREKDE